MASEVEKFFEERGFGLTIGYGERPALIVIDLIQGFTTRSCRLARIFLMKSLQPVGLSRLHERPKSRCTTRPSLTKTEICAMPVSGLGK
jgi:hypothetical protein